MIAGAIIGIVIGSLLIIAIIAFLVYWHFYKIRHKRQSDEGDSARGINIESYDKQY